MEYSVLFFFVEEPSIVPLIDKVLNEIAPDIRYRIYTHQGKQDLEKALPKTIPSVSQVPNARIIVIRDQDSSDCIELKSDLERLINHNCHCPYLIRIACKELESWFLGDLQAIKKAFPRFKPESYINKSLFRDVDRIVNPSDKLFDIISASTGEIVVSKRILSSRISPYLDIERNRSNSFNQFKNAVVRFTIG